MLHGREAANALVSVQQIVCFLAGQLAIESPSNSCFAVLAIHSWTFYKQHLPGSSYTSCTSCTSTDSDCSVLSQLYLELSCFGVPNCRDFMRWRAYASEVRFLSAPSHTGSPCFCRFFIVARSATNKSCFFLKKIPSINWGLFSSFVLEGVIGMKWLT